MCPLRLNGSLDAASEHVISICFILRRIVGGAFSPKLAKKLARLVNMETNLMLSLETVAKERKEVTQQLSVWGEDGEGYIPDLTDKLGVCLYEIGELEDQYVDCYDQYRITMNGIVDIESSVQPTRDRKNQRQDCPAQELVRAEAVSLVAEAQLSNTTREKVKTAYTYQFNSIREHCEKVVIIAGYGKHLLELIDDTPIMPGEFEQPYDSHEASRAILRDCEDSLANWVTANTAVSSKLSTHLHTLSQHNNNSLSARNENHSRSCQESPTNKNSSRINRNAKESDKKIGKEGTSDIKPEATV
ncbi:uncharacterized protein LMH87_008728 [Akanthomyces muscarius]|uniref:Uncharacterized protein n=1 Tax=Akanthomyces muscarius TaxID=2231603 RepID=A0A9W8QIL9_AKAMU|nr:uncharacterized protein LMH87_008728 [Akanthomyces muscarius]KAJ4158193.1 hypothetical protein LMH87_008728 [Akanthomyces muscarius]